MGTNRKLLLLIGLLGTISVMGVQVIEKFPGGSVSLSCDSPASNWYFTPDNGVQGSLPTGVIDSATTLVIQIITNVHEGLYICTDSGGDTITSFNLTVLALAKFIDCPQNEDDCDLGVLYMYGKGQGIVVNITVDFYGGGSRNEKQGINFIFLRNPNNQIIASCPQGSGCVAPGAFNRVSFPIVEQFNIQILISNASVQDDSGIYNAQIEVDAGGNLVNTVASAFTVNVTSTIAPTSTTSIAIVTTMMDVVTSSSSSTSLSSSSESTTDSASTSTTSSTTTTTTTIGSSMSEPSVSTTTSTAQLQSTPTSSSSSTSAVVETGSTGTNRDNVHITLVAIVIVLGVIFIIGLMIVVGACILARKKHGSNSLSITAWISIFRKDKPSSKECMVDNDTEGFYCKIGQQVQYSSQCGGVSTETKITADGVEMYAQATINRSADFNLPNAHTLNSSTVLV